jgi:mutator protein MutT
LPAVSPFSPLAPDRVILANDTAVAFYDAFPLSKGHALVVPLMPVISLAELEPEIQAEVWETVRQTRELLEEQYAPDGFNIGVNDGKAAGQTVPHAHVHVIPRYEGDVADPRGGIRWVIPDRAAYWPEKKLVTAAILRRGSTVLLTRRAESEKLAGYWEFPGGKAHKSESPEECLARELQEELSLFCSIGAKVAESEYRYDHGTFTVLAYEAAIECGTLELSVHDRAEWVEIGELLDSNLAPADIPIAQALQSEAGYRDATAGGDG